MRRAVVGSFGLVGLASLLAGLSCGPEPCARCVADAGSDGGSVEWPDAGPGDAGPDGGGLLDAGLDGGAPDGGQDAGGLDAGQLDGGADAGPGDAGAPVPDAGVCRGIALFPAGLTVGLYTAAADKTEAALRSRTSAPFDDLVLEVWHRRLDAGVGLPARLSFAPGPRGTREVSAYLQASCNASGPSSCTYYQATSGEVDVLRADRASPGRLVARLSGARFDRWDLRAQAAVDGGDCIGVTVASLDAGW